MAKNTLECLLNNLTNIRMEKPLPMITPKQVKEEYPLTITAGQKVLESRKIIQNILDKKDKKLIVITGPCSIHDYDSAIRFAKKLKTLSEQVKDKIYLIMRTYLEKPRTGFGWEGLIPDPDMDCSEDINKGYKTARKLLLEIAELGIPTATEIVDMRYTPQYIDDLISWVAIGARTVESQDHRKAVSGLSMPVGFKNNTSGETKTAVDAVAKARARYKFPGVDKNLKGAIFPTKGNPYAHIVLRGGNGNPNYYDEEIKKAEDFLEQANLPKIILVDCNHGNSGKDYTKQPMVFRRVLQQRLEGNTNIIGIMLETHHKKGRQSFDYTKQDPKTLDPNQSCTDACIDFETQEKLIKEAYKKL